MERLINAWALMEYCNNLKDKTIDANDIARFPTALGWISVKDRLPEDECECLVLNEGKWYWIGWFKADEQQWVIDGVICGDGFVTHWMPLPEPPEDEDDGRNGTV